MTLATLDSTERSSIWGTEMKRITAFDAIFLDVETPNAPLIIGGLFILDPVTAPGAFVRHRDILNYVEERLHLAPTLRRKLVYHPLMLDEPRLIDDPDFDLEFHIRHLALPKPQDWRQLKILTARLISRPMDMHRPLWEMYVVEGLERLEGISAQSFAVLFKMHHSTFDGMAAGAAMAALLQDDANFRPETPSRRWVPERKPDFLGWSVSSMQEALAQWFENVKALPAVTKGMTNMMMDAVPQSGRRGAKIPKTRFQRRVTTHRVWDFVHFDIADVQAVRAALGKPKMNDLLLCTIAGALRRFLQHHGELPEESLQTLVPVNTRGSGDPADGGNQASAFRLTLGTNVADPIERLALISEGSSKGKKLLEAIGSDFAGSILAMSPYMVRSRMMRGMAGFSERFDRELPPIANTVVTNAPLPRGGHYFAGAKVVTYAGFGPVNDFVGLFHTITGVDFEINISFTSCRSLLPDVTFYRQCLEESFAEIKAAAEEMANEDAARVRPARSARTKRNSAKPAGTKRRGPKWDVAKSGTPVFANASRVKNRAAGLKPVSSTHSGSAQPTPPSKDPREPTLVSENDRPAGNKGL